MHPAAHATDAAGATCEQPPMTHTASLTAVHAVKNPPPAQLVHALQAAAPAGEFAHRPAGHAAHAPGLAAPAAALYVPAAHGKHACVLVLPTAVLYLPASHAVHAPAPAVPMYSPAGQDVQVAEEEEDGSELNLPTGHARQMLACVAAYTSENVPAAHAWQALPEQYWPAAHGWASGPEQSYAPDIGAR